jgi:hypothetical protein
MGQSNQPWLFRVLEVMMTTVYANKLPAIFLQLFPDIGAFHANPFALVVTITTNPFLSTQYPPDLPSKVQSARGWGYLFCQKKVSERSEFFFQRKGSPTAGPAQQPSGHKYSEKRIN